MKNKTIIAASIAVIAAGAAGFFAGTKYQQTRRFNSFGQFPAVMNGMAGGSNFPGARRMTGGRPVVGEITDTDDKSITVKMADGSSRIVFYSDKTVISKTAEAPKTDLTGGTSVGIFGTENSDGSITAQNIQLNPQFKMNTQSK